LTVLVQSFKFLLINPRVLFPLAATLSTCLSQDKLLVRVTPRYLLDRAINGTIDSQLLQEDLTALENWENDDR
jgi:hypothetical protein